MRFFTSDLHFHHTNVIQFCNRPWHDVEAMNQGLIDAWNAKVTDADEIYVIGDMFFCGTIKAKKILAKLRGQKHLIMGNHDWGKIKKHRAEEFGFKFIVDQFCLRIAGQDVILNHFPYEGDHTEEVRFKDKRPTDVGGWLLHGHVHSAWRIKGKQINVGVDVWDYLPVNERDIERIILDSTAKSGDPK